MLASFHLARYPRATALEGLSRMGFDRPLLARTPGLAFWRLMGTGRGSSMALAADMRRWALFAVWEHESFLDDFLARSEPMRVRRELGAETYDLRLATVRARGAWGGANPLEAGVAGGDVAQDEPVAVLTRAAIRPGRLLRFYRATARPNGELAREPGLLASVGVGEWPLARQGTFSLWSSTEAMRAYSSRPGHRDVMRRSRSEAWYSEELFARFRPFGARGTWAGSDPLARAPAPT